MEEEWCGSPSTASAAKEQDRIRVQTWRDGQQGTAGLEEGRRGLAAPQEELYSGTLCTAGSGQGQIAAVIEEKQRKGQRSLVPGSSVCVWAGALCLPVDVGGGSLVLGLRLVRGRPRNQWCCL